VPFRLPEVEGLDKAVKGLPADLLIDMCQGFVTALAPTPKYGQNYHQWLSGQYGLKKLVEHIWMIIGMARTLREHDRAS